MQLSIRHKALGVHVFAGGFTIGVKRVMDVDTHLEVHDLGAATAEKAIGVKVVRSDAKDWPKPYEFSSCRTCFGNPRCTAFSSVTGGCDRTSHGAHGKQTRDLIELCNYAAGHFDFVVFESVQQAYSVGKPLLDQIYRDVFKPLSYRLCHLFINAATFGNAQNRRRYFFVAYRDSFKFNVQPPKMWPHMPVLWDAIGHLENRPTSPQKTFNDDFEPDTSHFLYPHEIPLIDIMPNGWCLNSTARHMADKLPPKLRETWETRQSPMPFSLHCTKRLDYMRHSPTLFSGSRRLLHPTQPRGLTLAEFSAIMGWPEGVYPLGRDPVPQLAKGICPDVGQWLAEQVDLSLNDHWGSDDWESRYDHRKREWLGKDTVGQDEKLIDLTEYYPHEQDYSRFPDHAFYPKYPVPDSIEIHGALNNRRTRSNEVVKVA